MWVFWCIYRPVNPVVLQAVIYPPNEMVLYMSGVDVK